jgi:hypothetical protein
LFVQTLFTIVPTRETLHTSIFEYANEAQFTAFLENLQYSFCPGENKNNGKTPCESLPGEWSPLRREPGDAKARDFRASSEAATVAESIRTAGDITACSRSS